MGAQRLGARWVRRLARITGENVIAGWGHGGYTHGFVTDDHRHGWYDIKDEEWGWSEEANPHYTSCDTRWPGYREE